jgi:hypothetical protein
MTKSQRWLLVAMIVALVVVGLLAQQQQSGGSGGGAVTQSGTWTVQPGNTANTTPWLVTGAGGTFPATESGTWTVGLNASTSVIGKTADDTTCGTTAFTQPWVAVPTSSTSVTSTTTCVKAIVFTNTNSSAQTVTVTDGEGTPVTVVGPAFSIPALSSVTFPLYGTPMTTGIKWSAGGSGVTGAVVGVQ